MPSQPEKNAAPRAATPDAPATTADNDYQRGLELYVEGHVDESVRLLSRASKVPEFTFRAAARLARIHRSQGLTAHALAWYAQALDASPPRSEEARSLQYDFADLLESTGSAARALELFTLLHAGDTPYRDTAHRVARLTTVAQQA